MVTVGRSRSGVTFNQIDGQDDEVGGNEEEEVLPAGSVDAGGASARVGDVDLRRLRERAIDYRKVMEELFRLAKKEFEQDGNYDKFKKVELR